MVYDLDYGSEEPTQILEARGDGNLKLCPIGEVDSGGEGGFEPIARGNFDYTRGTPGTREGLTAATLAWIQCKLATEGRWFNLIPHEDDFASDEIKSLCSST
jgi:hypothetical protein